MKPVNRGKIDRNHIVEIDYNIHDVPHLLHLGIMLVPHIARALMTHPMSLR